ncbi:hypothetical protein GUJ93_ZPchr0008g13700 [Zizania palustris]|uniref:Uncharacterized protein n=1 Tax=Zizania palustris TaxID=103762 RepID=A0A8J5RV42_ZIZPA|nr:hypothetical protein GUJ93_ZPchr0008g13700 [Zizania palustris]
MLAIASLYLKQALQFKTYKHISRNAKTSASLLPQFPDRKTWPNANGSSHGAHPLLKKLKEKRLSSPAVTRRRRRRRKCSLSRTALSPPSGPVPTAPEAPHQEAVSDEKAPSQAELGRGRRRRTLGGRWVSGESI